jgi:hypothetical protein
VVASAAGAAADGSDTSSTTSPEMAVYNGQDKYAGTDTMHLVEYLASGYYLLCAINRNAGYNMLLTGNAG